MAETTARAFALLQMLQNHRHWSGRELSDRLEVTPRTVRRDIEQLRQFGFRIESVPGAGGGYRLEAGAALPPLLLDDDEAVAMAIGLRLAATLALTGGGETTLTALAKLEQVLPAPLRRRVNALASAVQSPRPERPAIEPELLGSLALACRDAERIRFHYAAADDRESDRLVEPYVLVPAEQHWFLLCWDLQRGDWRTFRVDRLSRFSATRVRFARRDLPAEDVASYVMAATSAGPMPIEAVVILDMPFADMRAYFGAWSRGATPDPGGGTRWPIGARNMAEILGGLAWIPHDVTYRVEGSTAFAAELSESVARLAAAAKVGA